MSKLAESAERKHTPADFHIELKLKAYPERTGKVLRVSRERADPKIETRIRGLVGDPTFERVTTGQIQAYEVGQSALGVPTFVINEKESYAFKIGRWIEVGGPQ